MKTQQISKYTKIHYTFDLNPILDCEELKVEVEDRRYTNKPETTEWNDVFNQWCEERGPEVWHSIKNYK